MNQQLFLTPGGTAVWIKVVHSGASASRDGFEYVTDVSFGGIKKRITVDIDKLVSLDAISRPTLNPPDRDTDSRHVLAVLAIVDAIDRDPEFTTTGPTQLEIGAEQAQRLLHKATPSDREIRRYLARWVYTIYSQSTLEMKREAGRMEQLLLGCNRTDLERNVGVLRADNYLKSHHEPLMLIPTVLLVRDVERYGAARDDVVAERDYPATVLAYPVLAPLRDVLVSEWSRYNVSRSASELVSVYRALAPLAETAVRQVLATHGSRRTDANLGPMIQELQARGLGDRALLSKLNHIVVFTRDLALHGGEVSEPVLRIACETVFDVIPQVAALSRTPT